MMLTTLDADPPIRFDAIDCVRCERAGVSLSMARLDAIDAELGGNKWFKLRENLLQARAAGIRRVVSFGGAWSNHLHALAAAGARFDVETVGIVRGEAAHGLTPTLADARRWGMQLHFVARGDYRRRYDRDYVDALARRYAPCVVIPEGGSNQAGISGCEQIARVLMARSGVAGAVPAARHVVLAAATGATLCGIARVLGDAFSVHAVAVLHAQQTIRQVLAQYAPQHRCRVNVVAGYEHGGYAHTSGELLDFIGEFEQRTAIALDHVYTGKAMFALYRLLDRGAFDRNAQVTFLHTGGLQGRRGLRADHHDNDTAAPAAVGTTGRAR